MGKDGALLLNEILLPGTGLRGCEIKSRARGGSLLWRFQGECSLRFLESGLRQKGKARTTGNTEKHRETLTDAERWSATRRALPSADFSLRIGQL